MRKSSMLIAAAVTAAITSQAAMAYQAGDTYIRGSFEKIDVTTDNISDEKSVYLAGGYLFHDKFGVELGIGEQVKHDYFGLAGNDLGTMKRMPINLLANYYPLGGLDSPVQPFIGVGVNYTRYSSINERSSDYNLDIDNDYGVVGQVGVDLTITGNLSATGYARWADVDADVENHGESIGKVKVDPVTIGAGLTYRF